MKKPLFYWLSLVLLAGCHAAPDQAASTPAAQLTPAVAKSAGAAGPVAKPVAGWPFTGYHRYRGTVDGRPVLLELTVDSGQSYGAKGLRCEGTYFYERLASGDLSLKAAEPYQPRQPLRFTEGPGSTWQATQPLGPVLTGTWTSPTGRRLPFALHEDYQDAVRYEMLLATARGQACPPDPELPTQYAAWQPFAELTRCYLHLLGPDTLRPALRRLQCPVPARRRALVRAAARTDDNDCVSATEDVRVLLNGYGLLSVSQGRYVNEYNGSRPHAESQNSLYDLRTGHPLALADVLRPGADTLLERLAAYHLCHDETNMADIRPGHMLDGLDSVAIGLTEAKLYFDYQGIVLYYDWTCEVPELTVPYAELLPLLRPDSPVARMLRERGLWSAGPKK